MIKVLMAVLTVLVMASVAFAAYPLNHPCQVTQKLNPLAGGVTSIDPANCRASYFGAQDANRRVAPESGGGDSGAGAGDAG